MSTEKWQKENTLFVGIRIQNSSGIPQAWQKALDDTGKTKNGYVIEALREKLVREGYLPENHSVENPK